MESVKVLIACDNNILCHGVAKILDEDPAIRVVGRMTGGQAILNQLEELAPEVLLVDFYLPELNGVELAQRVTQKYPHIKSIIFSTSDLSEESVFRALNAGIAALLDRSSTDQELRMAVRAAAGGDSYLSPSIASKVIKNLNQGAGNPVAGGKVRLEMLTPREREVMQLVAEGLTSPQIADKLCISHNTVRRHRARLKAKLNLGNAAEITRYAIKNNIVNIDL